MFINWRINGIATLCKQLNLCIQEYKKKAEEAKQQHESNMKIWEEVKRNETRDRRAKLLQDLKDTVPTDEWVRNLEKMKDSIQTGNYKATPSSGAS